MKIHLCLLLCVCLTLVECAKILGVFPSPGYSQYILAEKLMVALAEQGHDVTVISGFQTKGVENLKNILFYGQPLAPTEDLYNLQDQSVFSNIKILHEVSCTAWTAKLLAADSVQALINSNENFDIVIVEVFFNEAHLAFAKHFNAHLVLFSSIGISEWTSHLVGNPNIPSYVPGSFTGYTSHMNIFQRAVNLAAYFYEAWYKHFKTFPRQQSYVDQFFPKKYYLEEIMYNASLMLMNSHVSVTEAFPLTTSIVEIGGFHIQPKKLPEDVQKFLDSAENGAIFFSMGSNLKSSDMSEYTLNQILKVVEGLDQMVLWKFEHDLPYKPDNLMISKWLPQADILAHPNTVAFISHCGLLSIIEAVHYGVPVIGIPIYGDQFMNIARLMRFEMAVQVSYKSLSARTLHRAVDEILANDKYRENARKRANIIRDRPIRPLDKAVYWIEYVMRHNGAHHLRNSIVDLKWYQLYFFDLLGLILFFINSFIVFVVYKLLRRTFFNRRERNRHWNKAKRQKKD